MSLMKKICLSLLVAMMAMTANAQTVWVCDSSYVVNKDGQRTAFTEYFFWSIGGHTALKGVKASAGSASVWFDLSGRRLSGHPDRKGIFVRDGKKVMMK